MIYLINVINNEKYTSYSYNLSLNLNLLILL